MEVPSFTSPGFPIYRALIVPRHEDGEMKEIIEVDDKIIRTWEQVLQGLRNYISQYHRIIERLKKQPSRHEYLETLADIIALYFRQPLQLDPIPSLVFPPLRIYAAIRKIQTVMDIFSENPLSIINFVTNLPKEKGIDFSVDLFSIEYGNAVSEKLLNSIITAQQYNCYYTTEELETFAFIDSFVKSPKDSNFIFIGAGDDSRLLRYTDEGLIDRLVIPNYDELAIRTVLIMKDFEKLSPKNQFIPISIIVK